MRADESAKRSRRRLGCGGGLLAAVVLVVLVPAVTFFVCSSRWARRAEAELSQIRAAGEPTTPEELEVFYPITRAEQETARRWIMAVQPLEGKAFYSAAEGLPIVGSREARIPPPGEPWPDLQAAEKLLEQYEDSLRQLHAAAEAGRLARYPVDFTQGLNMSLHYPVSLRQGAGLLALEAHVRARRGDARAAARSIHAILMLADSLKQEPTILLLLVRKGIDHTARRVLWCQLPAVEFSDDDLDRLQAHLRTIDYSEGLERAMMGDRVIGIVAIKDPTGGNASGERTPLTYRLFRRDPSLTVYLQYVNRTIAAAKRPWPQARREMARINRSVQGVTSGGSVLAEAGHLMATYGVRSHSDALDGVVRDTAFNRTTDALIAVERYRRDNGRLPKGLQELVPKLLAQVPVDPFDGQPLRYVVRDGEYVVYSVGRDGVDDGGQGDYSGEPDLVFPVQRHEVEP